MTSTTDLFLEGLQNKLNNGELWGSYLLEIGLSDFNLSRDKKAIVCSCKLEGVQVSINPLTVDWGEDEEMVGYCILSGITDKYGLKVPTL